MVKTFRVLLFINSALVFTKIISTLYTGLYISFFFSHINITHPKVAPLPEAKINRGEKQTGTKLIKGSWSSTWFLTQNKVSMKSVRGLKSFQKKARDSRSYWGEKLHNKLCHPQMDLYLGIIWWQQFGYKLKLEQVGNLLSRMVIYHEAPKAAGIRGKFKASCKLWLGKDKTLRYVAKSDIWKINTSSKCCI